MYYGDTIVYYSDTIVYYGDTIVHVDLRGVASFSVSLQERLCVPVLSI